MAAGTDGGVCLAPGTGRLAAAVVLLALAAAGARARAVTRLTATGPLDGAHGPLGVVSGVILVAVACLVLAGLVVSLARRGHRRDRDHLVMQAAAGSRWQRALAALAALALVALLVVAVLAVVHAGPEGREVGAHRLPVLLPAAPHLPGAARPAAGGSVTVILLAAAGGMIAAAVAAWWLRPGRRAAVPGEQPPPGGPSPLAAAVVAGSSALGDTAAPRAAIINCYAAMEESLATAGSPRLAADTPEELLTRAVGAGAVRTAAAARLTALFREARFSPHRLGDEQRADARAALDDIARDLAAQR